ncbi:IS1595 family transposase [Pedobacter jejuensis]|uniref:IS1595 family transposase n=1 Tax=Pedobacter jejuensis TaxID=1268550 RepID=A0A3N0BN81_9SPHI|nr:IS1595 family transposase [Pedobacter jejuensis]RNL50166.1 IS1595 family transposase [Pedobacter jejuensis]
MSETRYKTIIDLVKVFPDERACHQYLAGQRWDTGEIICPHDGCGHNQSYVFSDGIRYKCKKCQTLFTAKTNTFMEGSKLSTIKWMLAMYLVMHKKGISSVQLAKDVGVTQKTAWFMLQRVRWALGNEDEDMLSGDVVSDETFVGGKNKNRHRDKKVEQSQGRSFKDKTPVLGLMQTNEYELVDGERIITKHSKVKCFVVKDTKAKSIQPLVKANVKAGSNFTSDEWHAYRGLNSDYNHQVVDHGKGQYMNDLGYTSNAIEGFWGQCKRSIIGIYVKPTRKHLQKYFNEFSFRHNYRNLAIQEQIETIIGNMVCRLKYKDLIA